MSNNPLLKYSPYQLVNILTPGMVTLRVRFKDERNNYAVNGKEYTYKALATMEIKVGDEVIVESPSSGFVVVVVTEVDEFADINYEGNSSYKWVVQKVDPTAYLARKEKENQAIEHLKRAKSSVVRDAEIANIKAAFGLLPPSIAASIPGNSVTNQVVESLAGQVPDSTLNIAAHAFQQAELILSQ